MRAQWVLVLFLERAAYFTSASLSRRGLRHRHGAVAESGDEIPGIGTTGKKPPPAVQDLAPESYHNMVDYKMAFPTPRPAALNAVYCRGGSCQYRIDQGPPTHPPPVAPPQFPIGGDTLAGQEFCRGLGCVKGMGAPVMPGLAAFTLNCVHLFNDVGGGMSGDDTKRSVVQVHDSFENVCKKRVNALEVASCPAYANTFVGAVAAKVNNPTVGGTAEVCRDTFHWMQTFKQAEIDLKLAAATLPKGKSLLAADLNRFGSGGVGPGSPRGLKWREYVRGMPRYVQNTLPADVKSEPALPMSKTKYQIAPGSPDGAVPPVEVAGDLFDHCSNQFSEIMAGFAQTPRATVQMTKDWCSWQAGVSSWVGKKEEFGHPDWSHRTCSGMENLVAFSLRDQLADTTVGLSAQQVCKSIFLAISTVHRTEGLVKGAWEQSLRAAPSSGIPAADDEEMKVLLKDTQQYAKEIFQKLRRQKLRFQKLNADKMDMAAWDGKVELHPSTKHEPDLPSTKDFNVTALLALSVESIRQSRRVGISVLDQLKPWGYGA